MEGSSNQIGKDGDLPIESTHQLRQEYTLKTTARLNDTCGICNEKYSFSKDGEAPVILPACSHIYGAECISKWIDDGSNSCPMCRSAILRERPLLVFRAGLRDYLPGYPDIRRYREIETYMSPLGRTERVAVAGRDRYRHRHGANDRQTAADSDEDTNDADDEDDEDDEDIGFATDPIDSDDGEGENFPFENRAREIQRVLHSPDPEHGLRPHEFHGILYNVDPANAIEETKRLVEDLVTPLARESGHLHVLLNLDVSKRRLVQERARNGAGSGEEVRENTGVERRAYVSEGFKDTEPANVIEVTKALVGEMMNLLPRNPEIGRLHVEVDINVDEFRGVREGTQNAPIEVVQPVDANFALFNDILVHQYNRILDDFKAWTPRSMEPHEETELSYGTHNPSYGEQLYSDLCEAIVCYLEDITTPSDWIYNREPFAQVLRFRTFGMFHRELLRGEDSEIGVHLEQLRTIERTRENMGLIENHVQGQTADERYGRPRDRQLDRRHNAWRMRVYRAWRGQMDIAARQHREAVGALEESTRR